MTIVYQLAKSQDLARTEALVVASLNYVTERHGFGPMAMASRPNFQMLSLKDDPDGLWVAEDGGNILGLAWSWVCGLRFSFVIIASDNRRRSTRT